MSETTPVAIVGAGPHGLAIAAYLRDGGTEPHVLGEPMGSWRHNMPGGMVLRSRVRSSHIAHPRFENSLHDWGREAGVEIRDPLPLESFVAYGEWFQRRAVPEVDSRRVVSVASRDGGGYALTLDDGAELEAEKLVIAAGIAPFAYRPPAFEGLPAELVAHSADLPDLAPFAGKDVLVLGTGQSGLESAALLAEAGARPKLVARAAKLVWLPPLGGRTNPRARFNDAIVPPTDVGGRLSGWIAATPGVARRLPQSSRDWAAERCLRPMGAHLLRARLAEVPVELQQTIAAAEASGDSVQVTYGSGESEEFDRVLLCTGYRIDISRYEFLGPELLGRIERSNGSPQLGAGLESSLPGLHFAGGPAAPSFGPIMRFVVGTWYAGPAVARRIAGGRHRPRYFSYPSRRSGAAAAPPVPGA